MERHVCKPDTNFLEDARIMVMNDEPAKVVADEGPFKTVGSELKNQKLSGGYYRANAADRRSEWAWPMPSERRMLRRR